MSYTLTPEQVRERYGKMFCKGFYTIVDEKNGVAQIIETCTSKGPIEWDIVNRKRTGGVITDLRLEGTTVTMDTVVGEKELRFGPASAELGGQGIEALRIEGDRVRTVWKGIAGASMGIGACIPQADTVIETVYPDDFKMGGAHKATVEIVTPKMVRVIVGVDDTDTKEKGASWVTSLKMATPEQLALEPTALNSNLFPVNANGEVLFLSVLSTSSSGICGIPRLYPFFPEILTMSLLARSFSNASVTVFPRNDEMIAGGASLAPSL